MNVVTGIDQVKNLLKETREISLEEWLLVSICRDCAVEKTRSDVANTVSLSEFISCMSSTDSREVELASLESRVICDRAFSVQRFAVYFPA